MRKKDRSLFFLVGTILILCCVLSFAFLQKKEPIPQKEIPGVKKMIAGTSMEPTLNDGQVVTERYGYYLSHSIQQGDVVAALIDPKEGEVVKRVIAIPGDSISFGDQGELYRNGQQVNETYVLEKSFYNTSNQIIETQLRYYHNVIPSGEYLLLGDNRKVSIDSTTYGLVEKNQIKGRVDL